MKKLVLAVVLSLGVLGQANVTPVSEATMFATYKVSVAKYGSVNPLCISIYKNDFEMVKKLIKLGADVNEFSGGKTPLMYAARFNKTEIIKLLIANGAQLKLKDKKGNSALDYAKHSNATDAATLLTSLMK